ncbi:MAG: TonB-dependent receptor plug domain-containing protein, partial [Methylococcaceae bacterium]|nr:TonB-dependent receptor plug domain-containing protein [Methylococcaceae bacterium]
MHRTRAFIFASLGMSSLLAQADEPPLVELEPVIVTAPLQEKTSRTAAPQTILTEEDLLMKTGHSIGETLKQELGITSQSFGPGVGTPVIRGQNGPRVRVLSNAIGSNDVSQLSPDHATSLEPILAERIEVLRGPATLLYGSGAIGGVVNIIDNRIPSLAADQLVGGALEQRYDSAADETSTALKAEGGEGQFAYHLDGFYRDRNNLRVGALAIDEAAARMTDPSLPHPLHNSWGVIDNTGAHAIGGSAGFSWVGEPGFAGVAINRLENHYGIAPEGGDAAKVRIDLKQSKYDFKSELKNPLAFAELLRLRLGYTDYQHTELDDGKPGTAFTNQSYESRLELTHKPLGPIHGVVGFQALASDFAAFDYTGAKTIVPKSQINSYGVFAVESFDDGPLSYELGVRVEETSIAPQGGPDFGYTPISTS